MLQTRCRRSHAIGSCTAQSFVSGNKQLRSRPRTTHEHRTQLISASGKQLISSPKLRSPHRGYRLESSSYSTVASYHLAVLNLEDALSFLTGGYVKSTIHRFVLLASSASDGA